MSKTIASGFLNVLGGPKQVSAGANGPFTCPLHLSQTPTLLLLPGGDFGHYFRCLHSTCMQAVDPVGLLKAARKLSMADALTAFTTGREFAEIFREGLSPTVFAQYLPIYQAQDDLARYVTDCHIRLRSSSEFLAPHLEELGIRRDQLLRTGCGKVDFQAPPHALRLIVDKSGARNDALLMPYYNGPTITHMAVYYPFTGRTEVHNLVGNGEGVFLERQLNWPAADRVLVCRSELDALRVFCQAGTLPGKPLGPVALSSYGALNTLPGLQEVILLSHADARLEIKDVIGCRRVTAPRGMKLTLVTLDRALKGIKPTDVLKFDASRVDAMTWSAQQLQLMYADGQERAIHDLVARHLTEGDRQALLEVLGRKGTVNRALIALMQETRCGVSQELIAEKLVRRDDSGYQIIYNDTVTTMSNFTLFPNKVVKEPSGKLNFHVRVKLAGSQALSKPICLSDAVLRSGSRRLAHILWAELQEQHFRTDVVPDARPLQGFYWIDLVTHFDQTPFFCGIDRLGVAGDQLVFPRFSIDLPTGAVRPLRDELYISDGAQQMHGAATGESDDLAPWRELLANDNPVATAVAGGVAHILHSLVAKTSAYGGEWLPVHLIYTSSSDGDSLWETAFRALCGIFSTIQDAPTLPADSSFSRVTGNYTGLGNLPFFGRVNGENKRLLDWLPGLDGPAILLANLEASHALGRLPSTCVSAYDLQAFETCAPVALPTALLGRLRGSFGHLLAKVLLTTTPKRPELDHHVPPVVGHEWLCRALGVEPRAAVAATFSQYPSADWVETVEGFFGLLSDAFNDRELGFRLSPSYRPSSNDPKSLGWYDDGKIVLRKARVMDAINLKSPQPLNEARVEPRLLERGLLKIADHDKTNKPKAWEISQSLWETLVEKRVKALLLVPAPSQAAAAQ